MSTLRQRLSRWVQSRTLKGLTPGPYDIELRKDLRVPMDDGVELLADLITPIGAPGPGLPTIVIRGPYGRRGMVAGQARALAREGFPVLFQSCRGTWGSGGVFTPQIDEQRDGMATHRWVRKQPWCTGRVVTFGPSYMGFTQWAVAGRMTVDDPENAPDALCLLVTMPDFGAITWDSAAFSLRNALGWTQMMSRMINRELLPLFLGMLRPDRKLLRGFGTLPLSGGDTVATGRTVHWYQDWVAHERLTDGYWTQQSHTASVTDVTAPIYMITGWYDIFLPWQLRNHATLTEAGRPPLLTIGPWGHSAPEMGAVAIRETAAFLRQNFAGEPDDGTAPVRAAGTAPVRGDAGVSVRGAGTAPVRGDAGVSVRGAGTAPVRGDRTSPVRAFRTGTDRWHDLPSWPPPGAAARAWHLHEAGHLHPDVPDGGVSSYVYDPDDPTPAVGGPSLEPKQGPVDNAAHEARPDVLVFRGDALTEPVTIAGTPVARIRFRSSRPSFDVFVRICDLHPDGRSMSVCDGIRRIGGIAATEPGPDEDGFREVTVDLWPAFHTFAAGHRISVQVSSGAHPRYARNPGSGEPAATAAETHRATQEISHSAASPSHIDLPVWPS
ncbi:X-Pro dipeptidyl-peptidase [Actinoplanes capillaceus]|uniref:X-Pro dipeptidyl-peptidase n=1 Tax=Actinoplanes campanulatus TaxID=113559 RepID=A0ABQ3WGS6_9ACTN|nr:CocE/NonD family hydrolase [Actinoplanes capillaceus]GID45439.1 X-Pro dipeptidyl-peptidase [Actinoplanes capillaceus]